MYFSEVSNLYFVKSTVSEGLNSIWSPSRLSSSLDIHKLKLYSPAFGVDQLFKTSSKSVQDFGSRNVRTDRHYIQPYVCVHFAHGTHGN
jgi:hypothetical protein